jgi:hypothetical protein
VSFELPSPDEKLAFLYYSAIPDLFFFFISAQIQQFQKRFKKIPKVIELDHLTVTGDVYFGRNVTLRGTVIIVANEGQRIDIPDGCILENRLLSGNLTMTVRAHACMRVVARSR